MAEQIKDVNAKIDEAEAAVKKYASKDTVISIGGYEFTPAKLMVAATIVSSILGGLYGTFEVYKDYMSMKKKIAEYVTPDLTEIYKKLELVQQASDKGTQYTQDIKTDLKQDIRRNESVVDNIERSVKTAQREIDNEMRGMRNDVRSDLEKARTEAAAIRSDVERTRREITNEMTTTRREVTREVEQLKKELDSKIQRALDNPLAK
jgi:F0F1-type ATP synthase membrane subunit b/b'